MYGEGESWSYEADADVRAKFWGRSVELVPVGLIRLRFDDGDEYQWGKVDSASQSLESCQSLCHAVHCFQRYADLHGHLHGRCALSAVQYMQRALHAVTE